MSTEHTPGRLRLFQVGDHLEFLCPATEDGESILTITHEGNTAFAVVLSDMNARRLVACWNACEGITTESLERLGTLDRARVELLAALEKIAGFTLSQFMGPHDMALECVTVACAAIAKVEGGAV